MNFPQMALLKQTFDISPFFNQCELPDMVYEN